MILIAVGLWISPTPRDEFGTDMAKAGLQLAVIAVFGFFVNLSLKYVDERRHQDEQRLQVFHDIVLAYNRVKAVRRNLRTLGLLAPSRSLNAAQAQGLREQMMALNDAQLSLEALKRELSQSDLFKERIKMVGLLAKPERYLNKCVHERWEDFGGAIWEGTTAAVLENLKLVEFAGHEAGYRAFEENVSDPLRCLTKLMHEELFGQPSRKDKGGNGEPAREQQDCT